MSHGKSEHLDVDTDVDMLHWRGVLVGPFPCIISSSPLGAPVQACYICIIVTLSNVRYGVRAATGGGASSRATKEDAVHGSSCVQRNIAHSRGSLRGR